MFSLVWPSGEAAIISFLSYIFLCQSAIVGGIICTAFVTTFFN